MTSETFGLSICPPAARTGDIEAVADLLHKNGFSATTAAEFGIGLWHMAALAAEVQDLDKEAQINVVRLLHDRERGRALEISDSAGNRKNCAFDRWFADYRHRVEENVKNAIRQAAGHKP